MTLPIPVAALTQHVIALGKTRSGKSSKLRVCVEWLLDNDNPVCIVDAKGDWWGLKSSADGKKSGYPLVVFGGEHADVPINAHSGAHIAELFATGNRSCLIDLGGWMMGERTRFFIDFASTLFKLTKGRRYLVIPEVHNFCPKGKVFDPDSGKMLHWANRLASEGLGKGVVLLADSQRPQKVHNDFLTSCETLIACKVIHKADRDAIKDWIDGCADPAVGKQIFETLAGMQKPEAWVWSPEVGFGPKLITWPLFSTYDSFKPQAADAGKLKGWAEVDLEAVKAKLVTVVEEAKARDPRELMKKIDALNKEVKALRAEQPPIYDGAAIEAAEEKGFTRGLAYGQNLANNIRVALLRMTDANDSMLSCMDSIRNQINGHDPGAKFVYQGTPETSKSVAKRIAAQITPAKIVNNALLRLGTDGSTISGAERKVLTVLAQHGDCTAGKLALLSGYTYSGGFRNTLSALRSKGLIEGENTGTMAITNAGFNCGPFDELPTGPALRDHWLGHSQFGSAERKVLEVLFENPDGLEGQALATRAGYEYSGGFRNTLSKLRTAGVLVGKNTGVMTASQELLA